MFERILVPIDGSPPSDQAVKLALRLARRENSLVTFLHVVETAKLMAIISPFDACADCTFAIEKANEFARELLAEATARAANFDIRSATILSEGASVSTIVKVGRERKADLIVMGSHGRGGLSRALLGSVAEGVIRQASAPVLIVPVSFQDHAVAPEPEAITAAVRGADFTPPVALQ